jgi:hypothetical protein
MLPRASITPSKVLLNRAMARRLLRGPFKGDRKDADTPFTERALGPRSAHQAYCRPFKAERDGFSDGPRRAHTPPGSETYAGATFCSSAEKPNMPRAPLLRSAIKIQRARRDFVIGRQLVELISARPKAQHNCSSRAHFRHDLYCRGDRCRNSTRSASFFAGVVRSNIGWYFVTAIPRPYG